MPTIRQRIANALLGDERQRLITAVQDLAEVRRYTLSPEGVINRLQEGGDNQLIDLILQQSGYQRIGVGGYGRLDAMFNESARRMAVTDSRYMYHMDAQVSAAVDMWVDFSLGQDVIVTPNDPALIPVVDEFWNAPRNNYFLGQAKIHNNFKTGVVDGEFFSVIWTSTLDGESTIRVFKTDQFSEIICDPEDPDAPLYYVQSTTDGKVIYYADRRATPEALAKVTLPNGAKTADDLRPSTRVVVIPAQYDMIGVHGWPLMRRALVWARAYKEFVGDRATVAKKAAMYVEKITAKNSGQRQIDSIVSRLQSSLVNEGTGIDRNQNTTAGQAWVQNEQVNREWMSRDTGAQGAQIDGLSILGQFGVSSRAPLGWLGRPDAWQNRAVAKEASLPWYEQIQRYQTFITSHFAEIVEVVGRMKNEYGLDGTEIKDFSCKVGLDSPFQNDVEEIVSLMDAINGAASSGNIDKTIAQLAVKELARLGLISLGIRDTATILEPATTTSTQGDKGMPELAREIKAARSLLEEVWSTISPDVSGAINLRTPLQEQTILAQQVAAQKRNGH